MPSNSNLAIKGEGGKRIPISECKLQPLNLLIPGGAPVMIPKDKAWPGMKKKDPIKLRVPLPAGSSYDAEEEYESDEQPAVAKTRARKASKTKAADIADGKAKPEKKLEEPCKKATRSDKLATEAKQRKKLERQVREQEEYIAELKAKYASEKHKHKHSTKTHKQVTDSDSGSGAPSSPSTDGPPQTSDEATSGAVTDTSEQVRHMIKRLKIKAAGKDNESADFNPSEDSQILARKENGESYATIAQFMNRSKKQISKRHRELIQLGKTAETAGTDGDGPGETTDVATTDNDAPAETFGGLFDISGLQARLEATAAEQAQAEEAQVEAQTKEAEKKDSRGKREAEDDSDDGTTSKPPKTSPVGILKTVGGKKKDKKKAKLSPTAIVGGESGYESGSEDISNKVYIGTYAKHLLTNKSTIPEVDDKFDHDDCILLALASARRKGDQWLQMQADFANLTGRMVPIEVLKYKFDEGEKPEGY
ncbi:hypothetical protein Daus18300_012941 [Diaporthe australafricana]|uniref:Myb-like domain-containing protein n=1 Tax=Diaporthe australafricana TaxID=127596 RepID=A0ABR3W0X2_9PEZI